MAATAEIGKRTEFYLCVLARKQRGANMERTYLFQP